MQKQLAVLLGLGLAAVLLVGCSDAAQDVKQDATVTSCINPDDGTPMRAEGTVVNRSSETSNFLIRITYYDESGNQVAEGVDTVTDVEPNATSPWQSTASNAAKGKIDCRIVSVRRTVDPLE